MIANCTSDGYLNDPYKIVSRLDDNGTVALNNNLGVYIYESRPNSRTKNSIFLDTKYHLGYEDTIDFSYRYMSDDWNINSHTM